MYRDNGAERGYEDAIPVKRSRRSERVRSEMRKEAAALKGSVDFSISKAPEKRHTAQAERYSEKLGGASSQSSSLNPRISSRNGAARFINSGDKRSPGADRRTSSENNFSELTRKVHKEGYAGGSPAENYRAENKPDGRAAVIARNIAPAAVYDKPNNAYASEARSDVYGHDGMRDFKSVMRGSSAHASDVTDSVYIKNKTAAGRLTAGKVIRRTLLSLFTAIVLVIGAVFGVCYTVASGPSETVRNILVLSALQASATKWVPGLFLDDATVEQILEDSRRVNTDVVPVDDYKKPDDKEEKDKWAKAIDGMIYETISGPTFKGYVLLVKDPSRVSVGVATDNFTDDTPGMRIFDMADKYGAVAAINGGEYPDAGGMGIGGRPIGLTYSGGKCVWSDGLRRSFMGFDKNDKLIVKEGLTKDEAEELGIRDGVCFQTGKTLISNDGGNVTMYYADNDTGTAQRTAIGQAADGTVILLVTDGRTASSLGATHNDVIDVMVSYGAVSAGMLDGGSSTLMYYRDYYDKYGIDKNSLDEYQRMGLVNKYKAFTTPRRLPTCFIVAPE